MKQITSIQIQLEKALTIREILGLHTLDKQSDCNLYVLYDHKKVCLKDLSKLVVFSLTITENKPMTVIVEGEDPSPVVVGIKELLEPVASNASIQLT